MSRPYFLVAALPSFFGAFGHSYLGEREIFPKLSVATTGLTPSQLRILRATWHATSITFAFLASVQTILALKTGVLSQAEGWIVTGMSVWYAALGIAAVGYWDPSAFQGYLFLATAAVLQVGLASTP
jgi:hypothetical protein